MAFSLLIFSIWEYFHMAFNPTGGIACKVSGFIACIFFPTDFGHNDHVSTHCNKYVIWI
jgi:hypothetical protein